MCRNEHALTGLSLKTFILCGLLTGGASSAIALPPLEENERVKSEFLAAAIGDAIRKNCATISARPFRALSRLNELQNYAKGLGYTQSDIEALRENPTAKSGLNASRDAYLAQNGVKAEDPESYCQLGREEIEKNSLTGWLLRAN